MKHLAANSPKARGPPSQEGKYRKGIQTRHDSKLDCEKGLNLLGRKCHKYDRELKMEVFMSLFFHQFSGYPS